MVKGSVGMFGVGGRSLGDARVLGEVHAKSPGLYQVPKLKYGHKNKKCGGEGVCGGVKRGVGG